MSEEWFQETSTSTTYSVVQLTSITTYLTVLASNQTKTSVDTNVYTTNATFRFPILDGNNPIRGYENEAPGPTETASANNGTAVITGGVTV